MKLFSLALLCVIFLTADALSQSVVVTSKKMVYTRPKPMADFKKTFTVNYPKVKAATPALSKKIESTISYLKIHGVNIRDEINDVQWLEEADFEVGYNARNLLCITLFVSGSGAHPSGISKTVIVNSKTGNRIRPADAFLDHDSLAALVKQKQKAEIENSIKELSADPDSKDVDPAQLFGSIDFKAKDLDEFSVADNRVTFIFDYGFPHVIQALQPEGRFAFSWNELSRFIKRDGPFAKFISK